MNASDFARSMRVAAEFLADLDLLEVVRNPVSLNASGEFIAAALADDISYGELYQLGLHNLDYNILLSDISYLQFYHTMADHPFGVRYAFYPNPFDFRPFDQFLKDFGLSGLNNAYEEYTLFLAEERETIRRPAIRYEVAFRDYREFVHPAAHFHFGLHSENRWPVNRVLTPYAFTLLIAKMFYGERWSGNTEVEDSPCENDTRMSKEREKCRELPQAYFSKREEAQFFFS